MAIDDILDEHEQSERVLEWLRRNGAGLIAGVVLGMAAIGGWKFWEERQQQQQMAAAGRYQAAVDAVEAGDPKAAEKVEALGANVYASLAKLRLAKAQADAGQRDAAIATLRSVESAEHLLEPIVDQRVARLLIAAGQADEAVSLLADSTSPAALEILGDAQLAKGEREAARARYVEALGKLEVGSPQRRLLELKLTEVGGAPAATATGATS
ncbi:MAG: tetratricopeptide repeat protein [Proteobacteria bacterium]|nr:tetratricopeptide repeat protein [Pseudomonadota bacterium]